MDPEVEFEMNLTTTEITSKDFEEIDQEMKSLPEDVLLKFRKGEPLKEYSESIEKELYATEYGAVNDFSKETHNLITLYKQVLECDTTLERLEQFLGKFHDDIRQISDQIKEIQVQSVQNQISLHNRQKVIGQIDTFVKGVTLEKKMVIALANEPFDVHFLENLEGFNKKFAMMQSFIQGKEKILSMNEISTKFENLKEKVVQRIRQFLLGEIKACKSHQSLTEKHAVLIKFSPCYQFLFKHTPEHLPEIRKSYKDISNSIYYYYFKDFLAKLRLTIQPPVVTKNDLLAYEDNQVLNLLTFQKTKTIEEKTEAFVLGERSILVDELRKISESQLLQIRVPKQASFEWIWRRVIFTLIETVSNELRFTQDFFLMDMDLHIMSDIFGEAVQLFSYDMDQYCSNSFDLIGLLVMIAYTLKAKSLVRKMLVSFLEVYLGSLFEKLNTRFSMVLQMNIDSLKNAKELSNVEMKTHFVTTRAGKLITALKELNSVCKKSGEMEHFTTDLDNKITTLLQETIKLLRRLAEKFKTDNQKLAFRLINFADLDEELFEKESNLFLNKLSASQTFNLLNFFQNRNSTLNVDQVEKLLQAFENHKSTFNQVHLEIVQTFPRTVATRVFTLFCRNVLRYYDEFVHEVKTNHSHVKSRLTSKSMVELTLQQLSESK